jgi:hypothetical protein
VKFQKISSRDSATRTSSLICILLLAATQIDSLVVNNLVIEDNVAFMIMVERMLVLLLVSLLYSTCLLAGVEESASEESVSEKPFSDESRRPTLTPEELEDYTFEEEQEEDIFEVSDLSTVQIQILANHRLLAKDLLARKVGAISIKGRKQDIKSLQQLVDRRVLRPDQVEEWQAMGVLFGDVLANEFNLVWVRYEDWRGISKVLRWRETDNFVFPVPVFSKRVKYGEKIDVQAIYDQIAVDIKRFKAWELKPRLPKVNKSS